MSTALISAAQNPELVRAAADVVTTTQSNAMKVLKVVGITLGAGLAAFTIVKIVKKAKENKVQKNELDMITKPEDNDGEATINDADLIAMANTLYTAFDESKEGSWNPWSYYDDDKIVKTLSKLQTKKDWKNLCNTFATRPAEKSDGGKDHNLVWFLGANGAKHKADYQAELTRIGLPNALGSLNGRRKKKKKKRRGLFKKLLNPLTPFKATKNATKVLKNTVKKKGFKALFNPKTGIKAAKNSL